MVKPSRVLSREPHELPSIPDHELVRCIGHGSYGEVWLARNRVVDTWRAVKIVRRLPAWEQIFDRELAGIRCFETVSRSHPGLVDVLHVGQTAGGFYYVMELADDAVSGVAGLSPTRPTSSPDDPARIAAAFRPVHPAAYRPRTLQSELQTLKRLPAGRCAEIGFALVDALAHLHARGLVHRDVKPSNVIFVNGAPKLADIGLVSGIKEAQSIVGTEGYLPPEGPGTPQADLFSLGRVLYEIATGCDRRAFPTLPAEFREFADRREVLELNAVIARACAPSPRHRYPSAEAMRDDMALLVKGVSVRRRHAMRRRLTWGLACLVAATGLSLLLLFPRPHAIRETENSPARAEVLRGFRPEERARWLGERISQRDARATRQQIDLTAFYNGSLTTAFHPAVTDGEAMGNHAGALPRGLQRFGGVLFDVRGVIQLTGRAIEQRIPNLVPRHLRQIPVGQTCNRVHFLHGTAWGDPAGTLVARYIIRYADGKKLEIPLRYGVDILSWWLPKGTEPPEHPAFAVVWRGTNEWVDKNGCYQALYLKTWQNPRPHVAVTGIDFESTGAFCAPFLVALSAD